MFQMFIKINSPKMKKDGVFHCLSELTELIKSVDTYRVVQERLDEEENHIYELVTNSFGDESYLLTLLEEMPWFMKYVMVWNTLDDGLLSDMIEVEREVGLQCSFAS